MSFQTQDPLLHGAISREQNKQLKTQELIASVNIVSEDVMEAMDTVLTNKYAEGYPGKKIL